jgi:hypothetical protein
VIDIETGEFELADTTLAAAAKMFDRIPAAQLWFERIGAEGVHKFNAVRPAYLLPSHHKNIDEMSGKKLTQRQK